MRKLVFVLLTVTLLIPLGTFASENTQKGLLQLPGQFYTVLYVESDETDKIQAFISELEQLTNKIISVSYNESTHEFLVIFTDLMRNDTIYQILLKYFEDFKETDGYYPN